jgi:hypothetical protein
MYTRMSRRRQFKGSGCNRYKTHTKNMYCRRQCKDSGLKGYKMYTRMRCRRRCKQLSEASQQTQRLAPIHLVIPSIKNTSSGARMH